MASITPVFGMRGTGSWDTDERPTSWRQEMLRKYPRGSLPLTAIASKSVKTERVADPTFHWWEKHLITNAGTFTEIYTDQKMSSALAVDNTAAGVILHLKVDATGDDPLTNYVVPGSGILLGLTTDHRCEVRGAVTAIDRSAGASSRISFKLLTADNSIAGASLDDANRVLVMPTVFSEFGGVPEPLSYKPFSMYNHTSIKKASLGMSRTAMAVRNLRPNTNDWKEAKRETLENLGVQMEMEIIYGTRSEDVDPATNQPIRRSMGLRQFIRTYGRAGGQAALGFYSNENIASFARATDFSSKTWIQGGFDWLMQVSLYLSTFTDISNCYHIVGNGVKLGLTILAERRATVHMEVRDVEYGMKVTRFLTPFGEFNVVDAPLFNREPMLQYAWMGIPKGALRFVTVDEGDVQFLEDPNYKKGGHGHRDGRLDLWMVESGYEIHDSKSWFMLYDVGKDNVV